VCIFSQVKGKIIMVGRSSVIDDNPNAFVTMFVIAIFIVLNSLSAADADGR
jgi:hypothetical protein